MPNYNGPHFVTYETVGTMDHVVKLESIPDGVEFPNEMRNRIKYDATKKQLIFRGFMCKADYDRLTTLNGDLRFRRAIEQLFQISTEIRSPQHGLINLILIILAVLCFILAIVVWWQLLREPAPKKTAMKPVVIELKSEATKDAQALVSLDFNVLTLHRPRGRV